ncbi:hypothetical protein F383_11414 [Gossypium arboreum]|uniref:Uncharacterized protein n=1 Tax=Gossypium arboreum TaxID=29729 RepID=A0A0B0N705_GOSAR|nr:hypothetical protein F383_11414 [Gossypium arboreum]
MLYVCGLTENRHFIYIWN